MRSPLTLSLSRRERGPFFFLSLEKVVTGRLFSLFPQRLSR